MAEFNPTPEQTKVIESASSAFISACPGAGKTRCIVERSREVFVDNTKSKALAFLSFTHAAVDELEERLSRDEILPHPLFPHFIGTFDSFIWHFMVAPFGHDSVKEPLNLIADKMDFVIRPYPGAHPLPLSCFNRSTNDIIPDKAAQHGFRWNPESHQTAAARFRQALLERGQVDFDDVRDIARSNLSIREFSDRLSTILSARFGEVIIDEAQDCNPDDLEIIEWIRNTANIHTKVVCDPHQSIYGFRGGVTDDLFEFAKTFSRDKQLLLTGNFRSTDNICKAVHLLRAPKYRGSEDKALGDSKDLDIKVHILNYKGAVTEDIGKAFAKIAVEHKIDLDDCRVVAKTRATGKRAVGMFAEDVGQSLSHRLANIAQTFQHAASPKQQRDALIETHKIILTLSGQMGERTYHQTLVQDEIMDLSWRGQAVSILRNLEFNRQNGHNRDEWLKRARICMMPYLDESTGSIAQKIKNSKQLDRLLGLNPVEGLVPRTIHEVKGKEYPAICVVMTSNSAKGIMDHLEGSDDTMSEQAREVYVAGSRAEKLLVIACMNSQAKRLVKHLETNGAKVKLQKLWGT